MQLYMIGDGDVRLLCVDTHNVSLCLVDIKKQKKWLKEIADASLEEIVEFLDEQQGNRIYRLLTGKISTLTGKSETAVKWAEDAWKPQTRKVINFTDYEDGDVIEAFQRLYEGRKKAIVPKAFKSRIPERKRADKVETNAERILRLLRG